jgi:hypothetical protein
VEVAIIVTEPLGAGTTLGAVKVVGAPLAVCTAEKEPHGAFWHCTDQSTPELVVSLVTTAATGAIALVSRVLGGAREIMMITGLVTKMVAVVLKLASVVDVAVTVTLLPTIAGNCRMPGRVKNTGLPDAVCVVLPPAWPRVVPKPPHGTFVQAAVQSTPPFV